MQFLADFHIHSKYSYATSKTMDLQALATWGQLKGIVVMGTGDFTHPIWRKELHEQLVLAEQGLFKLSSQLQAAVDAGVYASCKSIQRFLLTAEISTIFRRSGRVYKTHSLIFAPSLQVADRIAEKLSKIGNIVYDGRPTLSYDVQDLLKLVLDISPDCMLVPAHIWTPHFGLLGAQSGFDSFQDCFGNMIDHIYAFEKGLSSSFLLNAQVSALDRFAILANSDAHSVQNLGREANLLDTDLSYDAIMQALKDKDTKKLKAGIEFFPELGKYFATGHRACKQYFIGNDLPDDFVCPVCHKILTMGVSYRVAQLADRSIEQAQHYKRLCYAIAPLQDIIAYNFGVGSASKKVQQMYQQMLAILGNEFYILLHACIQDIQAASNESIALSIQAMRIGHVKLSAGYDGVFGTINF
ncbi:MAG: endonuclease Q family protein [Candidatus Chromulinivorax sp.]